MHQKRRAVRRVAWLIFAAAGCCAQELPRATQQYGAFGFHDAGGTRLLSVSPLPQPAALHTALCDGGRLFPVRFEHHQSGRKGDDGRQTPRNFEQVEGDVFRVLGGRIPEGATCFLAAEPLLSSATRLAVSQLDSPAGCEPAMRSRFESSRGRTVRNCWSLTRVSGGVQLFLLEFARRGKDALASIALVDSRRVVYADYPAVYRGEGEDLWRADDGGALSPRSFRIVFLLRRKAGYVMGVHWTGPEGASLGVFVSNGGGRFEGAISEYWYQAPV